MKKTTSLVLALTLATGVLISSAARAVVIDFDSLATPGGSVAVTNQFSGLGVNFTSFRVVPNAVFNVTPPNVGIVFASVITANFGSDVSNVSATFFDTEIGTLLGTLEAFDQFGASLGSVTANSPVDTNSGLNLSLNFGGIRSVTIVSDVDGATWDNFAFTSSVPEPSTLALMGLGLAGIDFNKRKT